ncbi:pirin family protein [Wohlfahrtiimonas populi]|uniref:pirin family protein n=1 Tax=Wohlfahrtiimonas populi TaxID=1940240 RepID=UPI00098D3AEB|nr:pirin family protein [Wohlfahrtiimonas populi]
MKQLKAIYKAPEAHWVGDGFKVRSLFSYSNHGKLLNPFLLLDRAGPTKFKPTNSPGGVGEHPHRGFETVTIVYEGEVAHHDSTGAGGKIGPGDVQWMTAAKGILHKEYHSKNFAKNGGILDMVQLWVNLPAKDKMSKPGYQAITANMIPKVQLANDWGFMRVIAGDYNGTKGAARTFTPLDVWDFYLKIGGAITVPAVQYRYVGLIVLHGEVILNGKQVIKESELAILDKHGEEFTLEATKDSVVLYLSGEPINEPVVGYGPFVMNSREEIMQASLDYSHGRFGKMQS